MTPFWERKQDRKYIFKIIYSDYFWGGIFPCSMDFSVFFKYDVLILELEK